MSGSMTTRRGFLKTSATTVGALGAASVCGGCAWFNKNDIQVEARPDAPSVRLDFAKHPALQRPHGQVLVAAKDGDLRLSVVRLPEDKGGRVVALSMVCTHWSCDVDWLDQQALFECPCHGSKFDPSGKVLEGPAEEPLAAYRVDEDAEGVTVTFERLAP